MVRNYRPEIRNSSDFHRLRTVALPVRCAIWWYIAELTDGFSYAVSSLLELLDKEDDLRLDLYLSRSTK